MSSFEVGDLVVPEYARRPAGTVLAVNSEEVTVRWPWSGSDPALPTHIAYEHPRDIRHAEDNLSFEEYAELVAGDE